MAAEYHRLESKTKQNPKKNANIFSILSFWWVGELLAIGHKRPLENEDLFPLLDEDKTRTATEKLQSTWSKESTRCVRGKIGNGFRLFRALIAMFPCTDYLFLLGMTLMMATGNILQLAFLSLLISELMESSPKEVKWTYIYAGGICLSSFVKFLSGHHLAYHALLMALRWKSATVAIIYQKVFRLSQADVSRITSGYIINLIASDLQRFEKSVLGIFLLMKDLWETSGVSFLMVYLFGLRPLLGVAFMIFLSLYYGGMAKVCATLRSRISEVADQRVNIMNSIIPGIRAVKMNAWEWPFYKRVKRLRSLELKLTRWKTAILASFQSLLYTSPSVAAFISMISLVSSGIELTPHNTFMILALAAVLKVSASYDLIYSANILSDFAAALTRIQHILEFKSDDNIHKYLHNAFAETECADLKENELPFNYKAEKFLHSNKVSDDPRVGKGPIISLKNVVCSWRSTWNKQTLTNVCLSVDKGDLVFLTGPVGCGKSSLLYSILREIPLLKGKISCDGKVAWLGQQPWVFSGTIRENILFGELLDLQKYHAILYACQLHTDLQKFPDEDMTLVGERGIVLSGGQRARVGLARALYSDADVYLLDDPLSALDAKVGCHVFKSCISGLLCSKTRLVATHNLEILREADNIFLMKGRSGLEKVDFPTLVASGFELVVMDKVKTDGKVTSADKSPAQEELATILDTNYARLETVEEDRLVGSVSWKLYFDYLLAGMPSISVVAVVVFFLLVQGLRMFADWWLLRLTSGSHDTKHQTIDLYIYCSLVCGAFMLSIARAAMFLNALLNSSKHLHNSMLSVVLKAPVLFFETNPVGRIINRFSRDIGIMDELLPDVFLEAVEVVLFGTGAVVLPSLLNPWIILPTIPLILLFLWLGRYYLRTSRDLRRLEGVNRSPVLSHFSDTLEGLVTIRAYKREDAFLEKLYRFQDGHNQAWFAILSTIRWLAILVEMICLIFVAIVLLLALATQSGSGITALSVVYAIQLSIDTSQYGVRLCSEVENYMTSVERVITYTHIEQEPGYENHSQPSENWPENGQVKVKNLSLVYYQGGPEILKDVSFNIDAHEKIGIVGRTGAGKSSLVSALFRMPQPSGDVIIDDVITTDIDIQSSRRVMSVISQDPVLFTGSLRMNLDPFEEYEDKELWEALEEAGLKTVVKKLPQQLREGVKEGGANFSVGERQLLCLARALLKKTKIIVMDEATANVDYKTDRLIQETIRTKFKHCTVITIAHRLNTIIDYDRVLVLENGQVVEYDKPENLVQNKEGHFSKLYHGFDTNID